MHSLKPACAILAFAVVAGGRAQAGEFCVSCAGPDAHYACTFDGAAADPGDAGLKLYCITELAKSGKHASCSVDRTQPKPCLGEVKRLAMPDGYQPAPAPVAAPATEPSKPAAHPPAAPAPGKSAADNPAPQTDAPPKTVKEMVEKGTTDAGKTLEKGLETSGETAVDAAKTTGSAMQKAGKAVGDAAKKTWTCLSSLFGNC